MRTRIERMGRTIFATDGRIERMQGMVSSQGTGAGPGLSNRRDGGQQADLAEGGVLYHLQLLQLHQLEDGEKGHDHVQACGAPAQQLPEAQPVARLSRMRSATACRT